MKLYLSGSRHANAPQGSPTDSIGGFMSSTQVPNGRLNVLFDDISSYGRMIGSTDCMAIFLYNDSPETVQNVSIEQFLDQDAVCKFFWAAVAPANTDDIQIEMIGSRKEEPLNVDWFQPTTTREYSEVKVLSGGSIGDAVMLMDVEFDLTGTSIESVVDDLVLAFEDNEEFIVKKLDKDKFFIQRISTEISGDEIDLITPGTATINESFFAHGESGRTLVMEELPSKKAIGFWIKREVKKLPKCEDGTCIDLSCSDNNTKENLEVIFSFE